MPFSEQGKGIVMDEGIDGSNRHISLHLADNTELSGHGYSRTEVSAANINVDTADGVATLASSILPLTLYTANDDGAQVAVKAALYSAATGGVQIYEPEDLDTGAPTAAPIDGQGFELTSVTLNP